MSGPAVAFPFVALAVASLMPDHGYRWVLIVVLWLYGSALERRVAGPPRRGARTSPLWWSRHDRTGRSRLVLLVVVAACAVGWAALDWPEWSFPAAVGLAVVLVAGDCCLFWYDVRKARRAAVEH